MNALRWGGRFVGPVRGQDRGADRARGAVAEPGDHGGPGAVGGAAGELPLQGRRRRPEAAVGVQGGVGAGHQDGHVVGAGEVAEDLCRPSRAPAVEGEQVAGGGGQLPVHRGAMVVAVGCGHAGGLGGVGAVGGVDLDEVGGGGLREGGGGRGRDLGAGRCGERDHHRRGDEGGEEGPAPPVEAAVVPPVPPCVTASLAPTPPAAPHSPRPSPSARPSGLSGREVTERRLSSASRQGAL